MNNPLSSLDWSLIRAFLAVAEHGSLSAAARHLGASQPTLGRQIKAIEAQLGADLFHRHSKGFELTPLGQSMLPPAQIMRDAAHQIDLKAAGQVDRLEGSVRITASVATSIYHMPDIISRLRQEEPRIQIDLVPSDESTNLLYREADIAVRMFKPQQLDLITQYLGELELGIFASHSYLQRRGAPQTLSELASHDIVGYDHNTAIIDGMAQAGIPATRDMFPVRCDDNAAYWELIKAGCGIGFAQRCVGNATPGMTELDFGLTIPGLPVWLTAHEAMRHTPRIRRVWDVLAESLKPLMG
ncbi:LysR family transcriptional regulator [Aestuariibius sp. HNIBRBA575]|uniref:LysR family transcriptional regulator n=1 Tax=Aestuariibius sp. HNIBRBA575 TaxID=3233343 RepID=UPI0034A408D1